MARALGTAASFTGLLLGVGYIGVGTIVRSTNKTRLVDPDGYDALSMEGKIVVLTGGTSGIGKEVAQKLVARGATVVVGSRALAGASPLSSSSPSAAASATPSTPSTGGSLRLLGLDLSRSDSVRAFAEQVACQYGSVSVLVNNAATLKYERGYTEEGVEESFATNYVGPALLTMLLDPSLRAAGTEARHARVVNVGSRMDRSGRLGDEYFTSVERSGTCSHSLSSSVPEPSSSESSESASPPNAAAPTNTTAATTGEAETAGYQAVLQYANTKLCNALFTFEAARRIRAMQSRGDPDTPLVDYNLVTPGMVNTGLFRDYPWYFRALTWPWRAGFLRTSGEAAEGVVWACVAAEAEGKSGFFFGDGISVPSVAHVRPVKEEGEEAEKAKEKEKEGALLVGTEVGVGGEKEEKKEKATGGRRRTHHAPREMRDFPTEAGIVTPEMRAFTDSLMDLTFHLCRPQTQKGAGAAGGAAGAAGVENIADAAGSILPDLPPPWW